MNTYTTSSHPVAEPPPRSPNRPPPRDPRRREWVGWWRADRGSVAAEVTLAAPFLIMLLVFVAVVIHRGVDARLRVEDAAHQAARAASIQRSSAAAAEAARSTALAALASAGVVCTPLTVDTTGGMEPGGVVSVTVTCGVDFSDASILTVAGRKRLAATATEPIDTWRAAAVNAPGGGS
jgi:Flp pilus assembly protein TadG